MCTGCKKIGIITSNPHIRTSIHKNNSTTPVCDSCDVPNGERENIEILRFKYLKLQSQYVSPISSRVTTNDLMEPIINLINIIVNNDETSLDDFQSVEECEEFLHLHLTHLHTKNHNIFSPNVPLDQKMFGMFLSVDAV